MVDRRPLSGQTGGQGSLSADVEVQIRARCPDCENGVVSRPEWDEFYADAEVQHAAKVLRGCQRYGEAIDLEMAWFRERGYLRTDHFGETFPPEEEPCVECEGTGKRTRWVAVAALREALADV